MGLTLTISVDDRGALEGLGGVVARSGDLTPAMARVAAYLLSSTLLRFRNSTGPDGQAWPPPKRRAGGKPLRDSDGLMGSIATRHDARSAVVGTVDKRAAIHQFGGVIEPKPGHKALAVPVSPAARNRSPGEFKGLVMIRRAASGRPPLLVRKVGGGKSKARERMEIMFVLLASVTMPARPFLGINAEDRTEAIELCRQWLVEGST